MNPILGRIRPANDSQDHPLSMHLRTLTVLPPQPPTSPLLIAPYDQGSTPDCVGFSGALGREINEVPDLGHLIRFDGVDLYAGAKTYDGYVGDGTDIRSACKFLLATGARVRRGSSAIGVKAGDRMKIAAYIRLQSLDEIKQAILQFGSAWMGSSWYDSWFHPLVDGTLPPRDAIAGGHAYQAIWYDDARAALLCENSWGSTWGLKGRFWLPYTFVDFADFDVWRTLDILGDR